MNSRFLIKNEGWLYGLAFLIALGFRFIQLGALSLTDSEATLALQALHIAQGKAPLLAPQPGYILLTSIFFALINSTNFMARFVPALAGSALVFAPCLFREKIKPARALILAFLLAIDPGLVALSRQASGTILTVVFLFFAWGLWRNRRFVPAGILAGLAFLSGPSFWAGALVLGLTWLFLRGMDPKPATSAETKTAEGSAVPDPGPADAQPANPQFTRSEYRPAIIALVFTLVFGGTLFFLSPNGLSAGLAALPAYLEGWTSPSAMTPGRILLAFVTYEPLGIFLAILSLIRGYRTKSRRITRLSLWLAVALLLAVFYRQTSELVWVIIPLLTLAAFELVRAVEIYAEERVEVGVVVVALLILFAYIWFDASKIALDPHGQLGATFLPFLGKNVEVKAAPYVVLLGAFLIMTLCVSFVAFGWSARIAWLGMIWSFVFALGIYTVGAAWSASGIRAQNGVEFWAVDQPPVQEKLLLATLDEISEYSLGQDQAQPVTVMGIQSPALEWMLRDRTVEVVSTLSPQVAPPIVITPALTDLGLPSSYRGQDFTWRQTLQWQNITAPDWMRWLVYRQLPKESETIIVWARDDLFPDARGTAQQP